MPPATPHPRCGKTGARAVVAMPGGRGAHRSDLNNAVWHVDLRQARVAKGRLCAGDGPAAGQRDPNKEARGQKGPNTRQVAIAAKVAAKQPRNDYEWMCGAYFSDGGEGVAQCDRCQIFTIVECVL